MHYPYLSMFSAAYEGMPKENTFLHEDLPMFCYLLLKIKEIDFTQSIHGKRYTKDSIVDEGNIRKYEFWQDEIFYLYIKQKDKFFKHQEEFTQTFLGYQKIPLTYKTMSNMTEEEIKIIYTDFD